MNAGEQGAYGRRLDALAAELRQRIAEGGAATAPVSPDRAIGRLSRVEAMQAQQISLAERQRQRLRLQRVEHALELLKQGTYGSCTRCGEDIERARLDAIPDTFLCLACVGQLQSRP